jgi:hypothetical protein
MSPSAERFPAVLELYRYTWAPSWTASIRSVTVNVRFVQALVQFASSRVTTWVSNVQESPASQDGRSVDVMAAGLGVGGPDVSIAIPNGAIANRMRTATVLATACTMRLQIKGLLVRVRNRASRGKL